MSKTPVRDQKGRFKRKPKYRPISPVEVLRKNLDLIFFLLGCPLGIYLAYWVRCNLP